MVVKAQPVNHLVHRLTPCLKVLGELTFGAEKSAYGQRNRARLAELAQRLPLVGIEAETTRHYAQVRALLERQGTPIGANDTWIAAQALAVGATLVTDNVREFSRVPALPLENWLLTGEVDRGGLRQR